ncbi:MAG: hypothetical protein L3J63_07925 [Geopsychrobacter sp.]|nr:hypothetical protein [Geopsychrobacter sp.]
MYTHVVLNKMLRMGTMTDQSQQRQRIIDGIVRGESAVEEGRIFFWQEVEKKLAKWLDKSEVEVV